MKILMAPTGLGRSADAAKVALLRTAGYDVARLTYNLRWVIYSLVSAATERVKKWHLRHGNYEEWVNGPLVAIVKGDVIVTIIRRVV